MIHIYAELIGQIGIFKEYNEIELITAVQDVRFKVEEVDLSAIELEVIRKSDFYGEPSDYQIFANGKIIRPWVNPDSDRVYEDIMLENELSGAEEELCY